MTRAAGGAGGAARPARRRAPVCPGPELDRLVIAALGDEPAPLSAYALVERVRERGQHCYVMAVYRSLDRLCTRDLVERVESLSSYRLRTASDAVLMVCAQCGAATALPIAEQHAQLWASVTATGFAIRKLAVEAVGLCGNCRED